MTRREKGRPAEGPAEGLDETARAPQPAERGARRCPLSREAALEVLGFWAELEIFAPSDYRPVNSEFVHHHRWTVGRKTPSEAKAIEAWRTALWTEPRRFGAQDLRAAPGEDLPHVLPFFTVYAGILPKARLYGAALRALDSAGAVHNARENPLSRERFFSPDFAPQTGGAGLRGDCCLAVFQLTPWGKLVDGSFSAAPVVGALHAMIAAERRIEKLAREGAGFDDIKPLLQARTFTAADAVSLTEKLETAFWSHAVDALGWEGADDPRQRFMIRERTGAELVLSDPHPQASPVDAAFIEHITESVARYAGIPGELASAVRVSLHRPDYEPRTEDVPGLGSFYLGDLMAVSESLSLAGASPCGAPAIDAFLKKSLESVGRSEAAQAAERAPEAAPESSLPAVSEALPAAAQAQKADAAEESGDWAKGILAAPIGAPLARLLFHGLDETLPRIDLLRRPDAIAMLLDPAKLPSGRWPSDPSHHLYAAQQAAVSAILQAGPEGFGSLISVNGPPGTGKSWLLRDVVAEIVVRRAAKIAAKPCSSAVLDPEKKVAFDASSNKTLEIIPIAEDVAADGLIVVASNNNAAIENITDELPRSFSLPRPDAAEPFSYWRTSALELARRLRRRRGPSRSDDPDAGDARSRQGLDAVWGLVSATFGRLSNRVRFSDAVLSPAKRGEDRSIMRQIDDAVRAAKAEGELPEARWQRARDHFLELMGEVDARRRRMSALLKESGFVPALFTTSLAEAPGQHKTSLWVDEGFERLRSELFLAALDLHAATMTAQADWFKKSLRAAGQFLRLSQPRFRSGRAIQVYELIGFLVPVISTTLASAPRMFAQVRAEEIPWLLLDEASQATPMSAVGLLSRAKRAVVLGDPRQLMPVVTLPPRLCEYLRRRWPLVNEAWSPHASSLQTLADGAMELGAAIRDVVTGHDVWTGLPLRTHRRCGSPMFEIANAVSYAGQMVQMTPRRDDVRPSLSSWKDISGHSWRPVDPKGRRVGADPKIVAEEMAYLRRAIEGLARSRAYSGATVFVVSPFRAVADLAARIIREVKPARLSIRADTVHAFQGQEADVVLLVLGSIPGPAGRAQRRWASDPANLVNVAVTRARRDLVVIGNRSEWTAEAAFRIVAEKLPAQRIEVPGDWPVLRGWTQAPEPERPAPAESEEPIFGERRPALPETAHLARGEFDSAALEALFPLAQEEADAAKAPADADADEAAAPDGAPIRPADASAGAACDEDEAVEVELPPEGGIGRA